MQAVAAEFPGCAENSTAFWREEFKNTMFRFICFKPAQHHIALLRFWTCNAGTRGSVSLPRRMSDHAGVAQLYGRVPWAGRPYHRSARRIKYSVRIERVLGWARKTSHYDNRDREFENSARGREC